MKLKRFLPNVALMGLTLLACSVSDPDGNPDLADLPDLAQPDLAQPDLASTDLGQPDLASTDLGQPDLASTDLGQPDLASTDLAQPDLASTDMSSGNLTVRGFKPIRFYPTGMNCGPNCQGYPVGTGVDVKAEPVGFRFRSWSLGPCMDGSDPVCSFTMNTPVVVDYTLRP